MKMLSYNIGGVRGAIKRKFISSIIKKKIDFACIQETKLENIDNWLPTYIWGKNRVEWVSSPSNGSSSGLIPMWNKNSFHLNSHFATSNFIAVEEA